MDDKGNFTDDDWATIYTEGGASVLPSYLGGRYRRPRYRPYPSTAYAWLLSFAGLFLLLPSFVAIVIAVRAIVKGNRFAWLALLGACGSIAGFVWLRTLVLAG